MRSARRREAAAVAVLATVLLAGCASGVRDSAGQVTAPATTDSFAVRVGDCLDKLPTDSTDRLSLRPCAQSHYWEAFASTTLTGDDYPGNSTVRDQANRACSDAFTSFVGVTVKSSKLSLTMLTPTKDTWTQADDREVVCLVGSDNGGITGTLKGAAK